MPDTRAHRGPHPQDAFLFAEDRLPALCAASDDLAWLLGRGYASRSALALVGDRHGLHKRQRVAVLRATCAGEEAARRRARAVGIEGVRGAALVIDGYNVLITVESALGGGVLLRARDGCLRDMASLHGTFRRVAETEPALRLVGESLAEWGVAQARWLFDAPVSNSGRVAALARAVAEGEGWPWAVDVVPSADGVLRDAEDVVATADSAVLDRCGRWFDLARRVVERSVPDARALDFRP